MTRLGKGGALLAVAVALVGGFEGLRLSAYPDGGGVPTICYGSTRGVRLGQVETKAGCDARFVADLVEHEAGMRACLRDPDGLPDPVYLAALSFAYNVGTGAACASTLFRHLNAGDLRAACDQLPRWVRDNGRVIQGLVKRRLSERALCLTGVK
jgi:lysozyme